MEAFIFNMITKQIAGKLARHALTALGGYYMAQGVGDPSTWETIAGGGAAAVGLVWSGLKVRFAA